MRRRSLAGPEALRRFPTAGRSPADGAHPPVPVQVLGDDTEIVSRAGHRDELDICGPTVACSSTFVHAAAMRSRCSRRKKAIPDPPPRHGAQAVEIAARLTDRTTLHSAVQALETSTITAWATRTAPSTSSAPGSSARFARRSESRPSRSERNGASAADRLVRALPRRAGRALPSSTGAGLRSRSRASGSNSSPAGSATWSRPLPRRVWNAGSEGLSSSSSSAGAEATSGATGAWSTLPTRSTAAPSLAPEEASSGGFPVTTVWLARHGESRRKTPPSGSRAAATGP